MKTNLEEMVENNLNIKESNKNNKEIIWTFKANGLLHLGHVIPLLKITEYLKLSMKVTILIDDIDVSFKPDLMAKRVSSIKEIILIYARNMTCITSLISLITTSQLRSNEDYVMEFYKLISVTSETQIYDMLGNKDNMKLYSLIEPILYINDIVIKRTKVPLIGLDKIKVIKLAEDLLYDGANEFKYVSHPLIFDYKDNKMSKTNELTLINVTDTPKNIEKKIKKYFCDDVNVETSLFGIIENIVFPFLSLRQKSFDITNLEGLKTSYCEISALKKDFIDKKIHPGDLKAACTAVLSDVLKFFKSACAEDKLDKK